MFGPPFIPSHNDYVMHIIYQHLRRLLLPEDPEVSEHVLVPQLGLLALQQLPRCFDANLLPWFAHAPF